MCFTAGISLTLACLAFALGAAIIHRGLPIRAGLAIIFIGAMELLQFFQHMVVATPEDNYAMCANSTNQFLTFLGYVHYCFQPMAIHWISLSMDRRTNLKMRHQSDMIFRLCLLFAAFTISRYILAVWSPENMAPPSSKECPNYEWFKEGYDAGTGEMTPNLPGRSCTYIPKTSTGHLAWAVPLYQATYLAPHSSLHLFMCLALLLLTPTLTCLCLVGFVTGPLLALYITSSINEQPAIWCFFSGFQCFLFPLMVLFVYPNEPKYEETVEHSGGFGEKPLVYHIDQSSMNGKAKSH